MADQWEIFSARMNEQTGQIKSVSFCIKDSVTGGCTKTTIELAELDPAAPSFVESPTRQDLIDFVTANAKEMPGRDGVGDGSLGDYWRVTREEYKEPTEAEAAESNPVVYDGVEYDRMDSAEPEDLA